MTTDAIVMMVVYLLIVWGGLGFGAALMATHSDETAGALGELEAKKKPNVLDN
ncbi:methionine/alanine import family NSS transporter small subunit [Boudabousia tangfeifanii]|uniref:methionine/alanine import family NSS transporter small subunit n=1 Tax=Boudabousia tangfeifanii TaxID=1912795 RepID=UPI0009F63947|nr:methionine/alanine import family NSS transporter small subunit [Boudabousia tangfeifanii]